MNSLKNSTPEDQTERKNNKSKTSRLVSKKVCDSETQKPLKNETSRPIKNVRKISWLGQNFARPQFFEVPFYTPLFEPFDWRGLFQSGVDLKDSVALKKIVREPMLFYFIILFIY